ncbi:uncharacterized protein LOC135392699 isoform X1 [Ornithodoros turicata]|uniref:uncharacterized protein LOC135392699 isoform X1 n=1 Tax=Ornithodoros turicata TaxID=34597 RepID=UPI0031396596
MDAAKEGEKEEDDNMIFSRVLHAPRVLVRSIMKQQQQNPSPSHKEARLVMDTGTIPPEPYHSVPVRTESPVQPTPAGSLLQVGDKRRIHDSRVLAVITTVIVLVLVVTGLVVPWAYAAARISRYRQENVTRFCCPEIIEALYQVVNLSKDPCTNFHEHTCHRFSQATGTVRRKVMRDVVDSIFQMRAPNVAGREVPRSKTARLLGELYGGCLRVAQIDFPTIVSVSVERVLAVLQVRAVPTQAELLERTLYSSSEWYLTFFLDVYYATHSEPGVTIMNIKISDIYYADNLLPRNALEIALATIDRWVGIRVPLDRLLDFMREIQRGPHSTTSKRRDQSMARRPPTEPPESKITFSQLLASQPSVLRESWEYAFSNLSYSQSSTIEVTSPKTVFYILGAFLNETRRPEGFALLASLGAAYLHPGLWDSEHVSGTGAAQTCSNIINTYMPLWNDALSFILTSSETDDKVRSIFNSAIDGVTQVAISIYESQAHSRVRGIINSTKLILPSDRNARGINISSKTFTNIKNLFQEMEDAKIVRFYAYNTINVLKLWNEYDRTQALNGIKPDIGTKRNVSEMVIRRIGDYIHVPPAVYTLLHFNDTVHRLVNMAVLGVQIADSLWDKIIAGTMNDSTTSLIVSCRNQNNITRMTDMSNIKFPLLSIWTSALISMDDTWTTMMEGWGLWRVSPSQVFYMLVFYYHICERGAETALGAQLGGLLSALPDFNTAFNCTERNVGGNCSDSLLKKITF